MDFSAIDIKKGLLDEKRPLPIHTVKSLREKVVVEWTYHTNAIEGNTLTLKETRVVLEGITIGGKTMREHLEAINHREAIEYVEGIVRDREKITEWQIKNIHAIILKGIDDENAGKYRSQNVVISGAEHIPPDFLHVPEQMSKLVDRCNFEWIKPHPLERAALLHLEFVKVHPFIDGNGRTARLLMNFELMKAGLPPIIIRNEDRVAYYQALDKSHVYNDHDDFIAMVAAAVERRLDEYLKVMK